MAAGILICASVPWPVFSMVISPLWSLMIP